MKNMGYSFFRPTVTVFAALTLVGCASWTR
jgi:hypothetical protein